MTHIFLGKNSVEHFSLWLSSFKQRLTQNLQQLTTA